VFRNREALTDHGDRAARETLLAVAERAVEAVHPRNTVPAAVERDGDRLTVADCRYDLSAVRDVYVIAAGKGSAATVAALAERVGDRLTAGVVAEKADGGGEPGVEAGLPDAVERVAAGHPLPTEESRHAGERALELADRAGEADLVIACITGGASATMVAPAAGLSVTELRTTTDLLLRAGLPIDAVNTVRRHCSRLKGGRLAERVAPARLATLVVVDEVAGRPWGPTVPDDTTYADALGALSDAGLTDELPAAVLEHLRAGRDGERPETPAAVGTDATTSVLADASDACDAAADRARELGYEPLVLSTAIEGESREAATVVGGVAREVVRHGRPVAPPCVLVTGGETTVTVGPDAGEGGPNQEFALASAVACADLEGVVTLALGTDGTDGPTDAAGGLVDSSTVPRLADRGIDPERRLRRHDSTPALRAVDDAVLTGPTGTNVMDLRLTLVRADACEVGPRGPPGA
jgi:hydroxypyruvate reductase